MWLCWTSVFFFQRFICWSCESYRVKCLSCDCYTVSEQKSQMRVWWPWSFTNPETLYLSPPLLFYSVQITLMPYLRLIYFGKTPLCFNMEWEMNTSEITLFNCWHPQGWLALIKVNQKCLSWLTLEFNFPPYLFSCVSAARGAIQMAAAPGTPNI